MASVIEVVTEKFKALSESISNGIDQTQMVLSDIYDVFSAIGGFFAWLGLHASLLLVGTLIILYLISMVSPLERRVNYLVAMIAGSLLAYWNGFELNAYGRYMLVMTAPFLVMYGLQLLWLWLKYLVTRSRRLGKKEKDEVLGRLLQTTTGFQEDGDVRKLKSELEKLAKELDGGLDQPGFRGDLDGDGDDGAAVGPRP